MPSAAITAVVTADWHLSSNLRDIYRHTFIAGEFTVTLKDIRPKYLIILGDLTNEKDCHNAELVNDIVAYLHKLATITQVIIIRGNHDCINPETPFFEFVDRIPNITWITNPKVIVLEGLGTCIFLPHTRNYKKDWDNLNFEPYKRDINIGWIFCHNTFEGADAGHGPPLKGIPTKILPKRANIISGDIHMPQQLDQITYVGAPYTVTFGDNYKPRLLQIGRSPKGTCQMQSIPCRGIKKCTIDITDPYNLPDIETNPGDLLKVRVSLKASDYAKWYEIQNLIRKWGESYNVVICTIQPIKTNKTIKLKRKHTAIHTDLELIEIYGKSRGMSADMLKTGKWLMRNI